MPYPKPRSGPPCLSPYAVHVNGRLHAHAHTLPDLAGVLHRLTESLHQAGRYVSFSTTPFWWPEDRSPTRVEVYDVRGRLRPELSVHWALPRQFDVPPGKLHRAVDWGWDGDRRPRGAPIPGTGRSGGGSILRRPATQSERRQAFACVEDEVPVPCIRSRRQARRLPTAWDDTLRSDASHYSWKRHRNTQWKVPAPSWRAHRPPRRGC